MNQDQNIYGPPRNQARTNDCLSECRRRAEDALIVGNNLFDGFPLLRPELRAEGNSNFSTYSSFILQLDSHTVRFEYAKQVVDTPSRKPKVLGKVFTARYDAGLSIGGKPHDLSSIEFRVLKGSNANQSIQHGRR